MLVTVSYEELHGFLKLFQKPMHLLYDHMPYTAQVQDEVKRHLSAASAAMRLFAKAIYFPATKPKY